MTAQSNQLVASAGWSHHGFVVSPSEPLASGYEVCADASFARPIGNYLRDSIHGEASTCAGVSVLGRLRQPITIGREIAFVVVSALYGIAWAVWSHVSKKCFKRTAPLFANHDTTPAVIGISRVVFAVASRQHVYPGVVSRASGHHVGSVALGCAFSLVASATLAVTSFEVSDNARADGSALTSAQYLAGLSGRHLVVVDNGQEVECLANKFLCCSHVTPNTGCVCSVHCTRYGEVCHS